MAKHSSQEQPQTSTQTHAEANIPVAETYYSDFSPKWCQTLLNDPSYTDGTPNDRSRDPKGTTVNNLMSKTLFTPTTIRAIRYLYQPAANTPQSSSSDIAHDPKRISGSLIALISLGSELCSYPDTLHGGINTVLVDEIAGALALKEAPDGCMLMAVNFNVNLRKSVRTPGLAVGRAWRERGEEGRKWWVR